jgi:hypothetical protein
MEGEKSSEVRPRFTSRISRLQSGISSTKFPEKTTMIEALEAADTDTPADKTSLPGQRSCWLYFHVLTAAAMVTQSVAVAAVFPSAIVLGLAVWK